MDLSEYKKNDLCINHVSAINVSPLKQINQEFDIFEISINHKTALQILSYWSHGI